MPRVLSDDRMVYLLSARDRRDWKQLDELILTCLRGGKISDEFAKDLAWLMDERRPKGTPPVNTFVFACTVAECRREQLQENPHASPKLEALYVEAFHRLIRQPGFDPTPEAERSLTDKDRREVSQSNAEWQWHRDVFLARGSIREVSPGLVKKAWYKHRDIIEAAESDI